MAHMSHLIWIYIVCFLLLLFLVLFFFFSQSQFLQLYNQDMSNTIFLTVEFISET